jgi:alcohol dehydrogenase YqhD (iron-dependent ADH family)
MERTDDRMQDFVYYTPTKVYFGRDSDNKIGKVIKEYGYSKVLIHYGGGSAEKSGLLAKIRKQLTDEGIRFVELGGVQANPRIELIRKGIEIAKKEAVDFILAVGGGSVIDSAKGIGMGLANKMDPWDMIIGQIRPEKGFPVGVVLTIASAGSEMSNSHVVTNGNIKRSLNHDLLRPVVAFCNPQYTFTVSKFQTACGIADTLMHTIERYFTAEEGSELTDLIAEGLMVAVKKAGLTAIKEPDNYEARATLMWASSLSHNGLTGCGRNMLFPVHKLEHDLSGLYDIAHAAGLTVLFPAWAKYMYHHDIPRFCRFAVKVWDVVMDEAHPEKTALEGIETIKRYFKEIGMPTTMSELGISPSEYDKIADMTTDKGNRTIMSYRPLNKEDIIKIYRLAE